MVAFVAVTTDTAAVNSAGAQTTSSLTSGSDGDVCVLVAGWAGRFPFSDSGPISDPAGFTREISMTNIAVWLRRLDGTETDVTVAWQRNSGNVQHHALIFAGATLAQRDWNTDTGTGTTPTKPQVALVDDGVVVAACLRDGSPATTVPSGFTAAATTTQTGAVFSTEQQLSSAYRFASAGIDPAGSWAPASDPGYDWITVAVAVNQQALVVGTAAVEVKPRGVSVPSPNGYGRLPDVMPSISSEVEPERSPSVDVPLRTWKRGAPGDPYRRK